MKAVWIEEYGGPEVMKFGERPEPTPGPRDVVVAVKAASVNPVDWKMRQGMLRGGFELPMPYILGRDLSGVVVEVGAEVTSFKPGDEVYGLADATRGGTFAERVAMDAGLLAPKPRSVSHVEAASLALAGATALIALDTAEMADGERILIHAGAGGVGGFAVQLARHYDAWIAATCSAANRDYVTGLGADLAIDYKTEDFVTLVKELDLVFDTMGGEIHRRSFPVLKPAGRLVYISATPIPQGPAPVQQVIRANVRGSREVFEHIADLVDSGAIRPQVTKVLPLQEAARGLELNKADGTRGKIVIDIAA
jgi:NADPH:quinone reductase-like Zn-dependent oxidoreductase